MLHSPNLHHLFSLTWSNDATWWFATLTYISHLSDHVRIGELCNWIGELSHWSGELCISIRTLSNSFKDKLHLRILIQFESSVIQAEGAIEIPHRLSSVETRELLSPYHCISSVRRQISSLCLVVTMFMWGILLYLWHIKDPSSSITWVMSNRSHRCWPI